MADAKPYDEKCPIYHTSRYQWVKEFINKYQTWDSSQFEKRAKELSEYYYTKILKRNF